MSHMQVGGIVAAAVTALALSAGASGDTGKSPNGAPGPVGNPNPPAGQPQANGPQGPAGNDARGNTAPAAEAHGKSNATHGKSNATHGKSNATHGKNEASHAKSNATGKSNSSRTSRPSQSRANPTPGTARKGGREDRPAGKITICHATKSHKNPYVEITISVNGLHGHGPADDPHHHEGSWPDIIPAPAGGCPSEPVAGTTTQQQSASTATKGSARPRIVAPRPEVAVGAEQMVLAAQAAGTSAPAETDGASKVLGASASPAAVPKAALAARAADDDRGGLPFTGFGLAVVVLAAAAALLGGFALRRATAQRP